MYENIMALYLNMGAALSAEQAVMGGQALNAYGRVKEKQLAMQIAVIGAFTAVAGVMLKLALS